MSGGRRADASVVIVSYRPGEWLEECVRSVVDQAGEVIVVDNGSADAAASALAGPAGATVIRSSRNLGFAGGVNLGASKAGGEIVALLNDDAVAPPGWLASAGAVLADRSIAAVGPKVQLAGLFREVVLPDPAWKAPGDDRSLGRQLRSVEVGGADALGRVVGAGVHRLESGVDRLESDRPERWRWTSGPLPWYVPVSGPDDEVTIDGEAAPPGPVCRLVNSAGMYLRDDAYAGDIGVATPDDGRFDAAADRFGVTFAAVAFHHTTWDRLGPLAARYFAYCEDVDWCWRAQLAGLRLRYEPSETVVHRASATTGGAAGPGVRVLAESNRTLSIVRNAPRARAVEHVRWRWRDGPQEGVRARVERHLPWAVASRAAHRRRIWNRSPDDVWAEWAGRNCEWDESPAVR